MDRLISWARGEIFQWKIHDPRNVQRIVLVCLPMRMQFLALPACLAVALLITTLSPVAAKSPPVRCIDEEAAADPYVNGMRRNVGKKERDVCVQVLIRGGDAVRSEVETCTGNDCHVQELSCDTKGAAISELHHCSDGCTRGACIRKTARYATSTAECYDGFAVTFPQACRTSRAWMAYARRVCRNHCSPETGKCGVNSFGVAQQCKLPTAKTQSCKDSDGGKNYFTPGIVTAKDDSLAYEDRCALGQQGNPGTANDPNLLFESYCFADGSGYGYASYHCANGCRNGACLP
jgi:hypothetical protein